MFKYISVIERRTGESCRCMGKSLNKSYGQVGGAKTDVFPLL